MDQVPGVYSCRVPEAAGLGSLRSLWAGSGHREVRDHRANAPCGKVRRPCSQPPGTTVAEQGHHLRRRSGGYYPSVRRLRACVA